ncbi:MAG: hypothetical protein LKJ99_01180 [Acidaminococcaceae bacterium]|nr:hypothetical protein [Acidaminococcaceae bacterium]
MLNNVLSQILYGISGFLFGIFAVRNSHKFVAKIKEIRMAKGLGLGSILEALPALLFFLVALFIFPILFYTRTPIGGFVYLATFIFYNMKGRARK